MNEEIEFERDWNKIVIALSVILSLIGAYIYFTNTDATNGKIDNITVEVRAVKGIVSNDVVHLSDIYSSLASGYQNISASCNRTAEKYILLSKDYSDCTATQASLNSNLISSTSNLQNCQTDKANYQTSALNCQNMLNILNNMTLLNAALVNANLTELALNNTILNTNLTIQQANYYALANNTAHLLCCVLINQTSANYTIASNAISCIDSGDKNVTC